MQATAEATISDGELVQRTRQGDTSAYGELVRRWTPRILAVCHSKVGRAGVAEDLAQETLLRGFRSLSTLEDPGRFGAWLWGIAVRACLDWLKAKERTVVNMSALAREGEVALAGSARAEEPELDREDEARRLLGEVQALPEELRETLMLFYYQERSYRDIARVLGVSTATVNARLTRARAMLRARLSGAAR